MSTIVADTSFLFALYGRDAHTAAAQSWVRQSRRPLSVSILGRYELQNAIRFAAFRKVISSTEAMASLEAFETDLRDGLVHLATCDLAAVLGEAAKLSERHTISGGHRSFDVLHVATARQLKAGTFLSFDANQRKLAAVVRLNIGP